MMTRAINCENFDERLADYLEGHLEPAEQRAAEAHLTSCLRCAALVRDLDGIRSSAATLPELVPSRDLWNGIAQRIEAEVIPLVAPARPAVVLTTRRRSFDRLRVAAVAAALVAVTAGVTYTLTMASNRQGNDAIASADQPGSNGQSDTAIPRAALGDTAASTSQQVAQADTAAEPSNDAPDRAGASAQAVRNAPESATHSREIDRLRAVFTRNRAQLDPRTAAIIEANLKVIDEAIAQSKAALAQDPASRFLTDQLNGALEKKLELLRTAALLPAT